MVKPLLKKMKGKKREKKRKEKNYLWGLYYGLLSIPAAPGCVSGDVAECGPLVLWWKPGREEERGGTQD